MEAAEKQKAIEERTTEAGGMKQEMAMDIFRCVLPVKALGKLPVRLSCLSNSPVCASAARSVFSCACVSVCLSVCALLFVVGFAARNVAGKLPPIVARIKCGNSCRRCNVPPH